MSFPKYFCIFFKNYTTLISQVCIYKDYIKNVLKIVLPCSYIFMLIFLIHSNRNKKVPLQINCQADHFMLLFVKMVKGTCIKGGLNVFPYVVICSVLLHLPQSMPMLFVHINLGDGELNLLDLAAPREDPLLHRPYTRNPRYSCTRNRNPWSLIGYLILQDLDLKTLCFIYSNAIETLLQQCRNKHNNLFYNSICKSLIALIACN